MIPIFTVTHLSNDQYILSPFRIVSEVSFCVNPYMYCSHALFSHSVFSHRTLHTHTHCLSSDISLLRHNADIGSRIASHLARLRSSSCRRHSSYPGNHYRHGVYVTCRTQTPQQNVVVTVSTTTDH